jgi:hypothetical protein
MPFRLILICGFMICMTITGCATPTPNVIDISLSGTPEEDLRTWGSVHSSDLTYPRTIGQYELVEVHDFDQVELGVSLKYRDQSYPDVRIDVYLYPISKHRLASLADVIDQETRTLQGGIEEVAERDGWMVEPAAAAFLFPTSPELPPGILSTRRLSKADKSKDTFAFVAVRDHTFFKVRLTASEGMGVDWGGQFPEVIDVLYSAIHRNQPAPEPELMTNILANTYEASGGQGCALAAWILYGHEMAMQIERGRYLPSFERELAVRRRAVDYWVKRRQEEPAGSCFNPALDSLATADSAGFFREYVYEAYDDGYWEQPVDLKLDAFVEWANATLSVHDQVQFPGTQITWKEVEETGEP